MNGSRYSCSDMVGVNVMFMRRSMESVVRSRSANTYLEPYVDVDVASASSTRVTYCDSEWDLESEGPMLNVSVSRTRALRPNETLRFHWPAASEPQL